MSSTSIDLLPLGIGLGCLLALHLVVVGGGKGEGGRTVMLYALGVCVTVIATGLYFSPPRFVPSASSSIWTINIAEGLRQGLSDEAQPEILFLDGGSYTARGVDPAQLEQRLSGKLGRGFKIVPLAVPGGNQAERAVLLHDALALLSREERARLQRAKVSLLLEVHEAYDRYPLAQLGRNPRSDRSFAYVRPGVVLNAFEDGLGDLDKEIKRELAADAIVLGTMNAFGVGRATRVARPGSLDPGELDQLLRRPAKGFVFRGLDGLIRQAGQSHRSPVADFPDERIRDRRRYISETIGARDIRTIYFSVPSTSTRNLNYSREFCLAYGGQASGCISHSNRWLLRRLDQARYWYDSGHLLRPGARQYTRWLADRLVEDVFGKHEDDAR